jgi:hypothetical protein
MGRGGDRRGTAAAAAPRAAWRSQSLSLGEAEGGVESSGHEKMLFTVLPHGWTTDGSSHRGNDFALLSLPVVVFCGTTRKSNDREVFGYVANS